MKGLSFEIYMYQKLEYFQVVWNPYTDKIQRKYVAPLQGCLQTVVTNETLSLACSLNYLYSLTTPYTLE